MFFEQLYAHPWEEIHVLVEGFSEDWLPIFPGVKQEMTKEHGSQEETGRKQLSRDSEPYL